MGFRQLVRVHIHRCMSYFRYRATAHQQLMGELPGTYDSHRGTNVIGTNAIIKSRFEKATTEHTEITNLHFISPRSTLFVAFAKLV